MDAGTTPERAISHCLEGSESVDFFSPLPEYSGSLIPPPSALQCGESSDVEEVGAPGLGIDDRVREEGCSYERQVSTGTVSQGTMVPESSLEISSQDLAGGDGNEEIMLFVPPEIAPGYVGEDEHVAESMGAGSVELAAGLVQLEDGVSSSDARCQGLDEGDDEVLSHRRRFGDVDDGVRNLMQQWVRARLV